MATVNHNSSENKWSKYFKIWFSKLTKRECEKSEVNFLVLPKTYFGPTNLFDSDLNKNSFLVIKSDNFISILHRKKKFLLPQFIPRSLHCLNSNNPTEYINRRRSYPYEFSDRTDLFDSVTSNKCILKPKASPSIWKERPFTYSYARPDSSTVSDDCKSSCQFNNQFTNKQVPIVDASSSYDIKSDEANIANETTTLENKIKTDHTPLHCDNDSSLHNVEKKYVDILKNTLKNVKENWSLVSKKARGMYFRNRDLFIGETVDHGSAQGIEKDNNETKSENSDNDKPKAFKTDLKSNIHKLKSESTCSITESPMSDVSSRSASMCPETKSHSLEDINKGKSLLSSRRISSSESNIKYISLISVCNKKFIKSTIKENSAKKRPSSTAFSESVSFLIRKHSRTPAHELVEIPLDCCPESNFEDKYSLGKSEDENEKYSDRISSDLSTGAILIHKSSPNYNLDSVENLIGCDILPIYKSLSNDIPQSTFSDEEIPNNLQNRDMQAPKEDDYEVLTNEPNFPPMYTESFIRSDVDTLNIPQYPLSVSPSSIFDKCLSSENFEELFRRYDTSASQSIPNLETKCPDIEVDDQSIPTFSRSPIPQVDFDNNSTLSHNIMDSPRKLSPSSCHNQRSPATKSPITVQEWIDHLPGVAQPLSDEEIDCKWNVESVVNGDKSALVRRKSNDFGSESSPPFNNKVIDVFSDVGSCTTDWRSENLPDSDDLGLDEEIPRMGPLTPRQIQTLLKRKEQKFTLFSRDSPGRKSVCTASVFSSGSQHTGTSIETLLESRQLDPVDILLNLGFGSSQEDTGISRIPTRFLKPSKVRGNEINVFLKHEENISDMVKSSECVVPKVTSQGLRRISFKAVSPIFTNLIETVREGHQFKVTKEKDISKSRFARVAKGLGQQASFTRRLLMQASQTRSVGRKSVLRPENRLFLDMQGKLSGLSNKNCLILGKTDSNNHSKKGFRIDSQIHPTLCEESEPLEKIDVLECTNNKRDVEQADISTENTQDLKSIQSISSKLTLSRRSQSLNPISQPDGESKSYQNQNIIEEDDVFLPSSEKLSTKTDNQIPIRPPRLKFLSPLDDGDRRFCPQSTKELKSCKPQTSENKLWKVESTASLEQPYHLFEPITGSSRRRRASLPGSVSDLGHNRHDSDSYITTTLESVQNSINAALMSVVHLYRIHNSKSNKPGSLETFKGRCEDSVKLKERIEDSATLKGRLEDTVTIKGRFDDSIAIKRRFEDSSKSRPFLVDEQIKGLSQVVFPIASDQQKECSSSDQTKSQVERICSNSALAAEEAARVVAQMRSSIDSVLGKLERCWAAGYDSVRPPPDESLLSPSSVMSDLSLDNFVVSDAFDLGIEPSLASYDQSHFTTPSTAPIATTEKNQSPLSDNNSSCGDSLNDHAGADSGAVGEWNDGKASVESSLGGSWRRPRVDRSPDSMMNDSSMVERISRHIEHNLGERVNRLTRDVASLTRQMEENSRNVSDIKDKLSQMFDFLQTDRKS